MDSEAGMQDAPGAQLISQLREDVDVTGEDSPDVDNGLTDVQEENEDRDGSTTAPQSRVHSRHVSRLSAALSLREVGGLAGALMRIPRSPDGEVEVDNLDEDDAVEEWTGSEAELRGDGESSADEVRFCSIHRVCTRLTIPAEHRRMVESVRRGTCTPATGPSPRAPSRPPGDTAKVTQLPPSAGERTQLWFHVQSR